MLKALSLSALFFFTLSSSHAQRVHINPILVDSSFDAASLQKLQEACALLDSVLNSPAFADTVRKTRFRRFNRGLTSEQILDVILSGMNDYSRAPKDYSIDLRVSIYDRYKGGSEYGNTNMNKPRVTTTHRCYVLNNDVRCYASHLAHEYMHQIGFVDSERLWQKKDGSVPYLINGIVDALLNTPGVCPAQTGVCTK
jgi:hypothetical protein